MSREKSVKSISIVIPCFNDAVLLGRALASLTQQSVPADEVLVVDNNSTDESAEVARSFPGVRVITEPRQGITHATRAGFDAATGDLIFRTDADVVAPPDFLARLLDAWDAAEQSETAGGRRVVAVTGSAEFEIDGLRGRLATAAYLGAYRASVGSALGHHPFYGTNLSVRSEWWRGIRTRVDLGDPRVHDDMHLSFQVGPDETVWFQPDLVVRMDPRALHGTRQLLRRFSRGMHTMAVNFQTQSPPRRLAERGVIHLPKRGPR